MHTRRIPLLAALGAALSAALIVSPAAANAKEAPGQDKPGHYSFAVIGDVPYGADQVGAFPSMIDRINAEPGIELAFHVGDIKTGSSPCTDEYNASIRAQFDRFDTPLVYTPGDNEWTDCHRPAAGGYDPLERLTAVRAAFFATPGQTLGADPIRVDSQADLGIPENVSLRRQGVAFAALHVVGSNNGLAPWTGLTTPQPAQLAEEQARMDAVIALVRDTFSDARRRNDRAVVLFQQADMFDPTVAPKPSNTSAFTRLVQVIVDESGSFGGEVYLIDGDSHRYHVDQPVAAGSSWLDYYGVVGAADNLTRITVDGEQQNVDFLKVTVNRPGAEHVLSWERINYDS
ncbi:hypothetical protein [Agromyces badenianii]|uniref:hypothetical protein n=1 Tax=Agromyces badenianii TaxID=2080742 RepID=UPI000D5A032C|nr:hypothetical protein [Agromyces badenianii]PWC04331.1 hypothetical protein DCE94_09285 [Agromyces badenianii]